jgi:hypothetical protein
MTSFTQTLSSTDSSSHFALFQTGSTYALGLEDGVSTTGFEGVGDYQDSVFVISTPEPSTMALMVLGLAGVLAVRRRRRA